MLGTAACDKPECETSYPVVDVVVTGAFTSYALSGACSGAGTSADCRALTCDAGPCPCHIAVPVRPGADAPTSFCRIEVASQGRYFVVDVGVLGWSDGCRHVELADTSQATIAVDLSDG